MRQGTGMALEDAHALAAAIGEHGPTEAALRAYEAVRVPRIRHISDTVMVCGQLNPSLTLDLP